MARIRRPLSFILPGPCDPIDRFTRFPWWRRWFGHRSERFAWRYLRRLGYRLVAQNLEDHAGEIDLLVLDGKTLVIVEVRSSETRTMQELAATVGPEKQKRLSQAAQRFLSRRRLLNQIQVRFDVLAIRWPSDQREPEVRHYRHAFETFG